MCLLCPCKSEILVKFSSLCFHGERQVIPSLAFCTCCCPCLNTVRIAQGPAVILMQQLNMESLLAKKNQMCYFCRTRGSLPLYAVRDVKRSGYDAAPSAPASGSLGQGGLGAQHMKWSKGMLLDFFRKSASVIVIPLIILSSL